jgi:hypothetical protein
MESYLSSDEKSRLARQLRQLMPVQTTEPDKTLNNAEGAAFLGGLSQRTLKRSSFPEDLDGPVPIRYSENGNVYWSRRDLEGYKIRRQIRTETNLMDSVNSRSLLTDLMDF